MRRGGDGVPVTLLPMGEADFAVWRQRSITGFAAELSAATRTEPTVALAEAHRQFAQLLPQGPSTPGVHLLRVLHRDEAVGVLWIGPHPRQDQAAWIYEIEIDEPFRGRGLARAALTAAEAMLQAEGLRSVGLNVFGGNDAAHHLYESLGYRTVATEMEKDLAAGSP